jgi:hypothetical protein
VVAGEKAETATTDAATTVAVNFILFVVGLVDESCSLSMIQRNYETLEREIVLLCTTTS